MIEDNIILLGWIKDESRFAFDLHKLNTASSPTALKEMAENNIHRYCNSCANNIDLALRTGVLSEIEKKTLEAMRSECGTNKLCGKVSEYVGALETKYKIEGKYKK